MLHMATPKTPRVTVTGGDSARIDGVAGYCIHGICILPLPSLSLSLALARVYTAFPPISVLPIMQSQKLCLKLFLGGSGGVLGRDNGSTCGQQ